MRRMAFLLSLVAVCATIITTAPALAAGAPVDAVRDYLAIHGGDLGIAPGDLDGLVVTDQYTSKHNGVTHIYFRQTVNGLPVINGVMNANIASDGRVISVGNRLVSNLNARANSPSPRLSADAAILRGAEHVGLPGAAQLRLLSAASGIDMESLFASRELSLDDIPVRLRYYGTPSGDVRLTWEVRLRLPNQRHWWNLYVDAESGAVLGQIDWTAQDSYRVFAYPKESPLDGDTTLEVDPADPEVSPFGWHDTDGIPGAEFTDTRGNNVEAQEDQDANNIPGLRPNGGADLNFDFPFDPELEPVGNLLNATTNLFYWNNIVHDLMYKYGFDEAAGNFQTNNFGRGGVGGDPVQADALDGSGTNNATFSTPGDGGDGRMTMFLWLAPPNLTVNSPPNIAGDYKAGGAEFGEQLDEMGLTGDLELVDDGTGLPTEGCNDLVGFTAGKVAVIDRGSCEFGQKVLNAEDAGAVAAIVVNNQGDGTLTMGAGQVGNQVTIPSVFIGQSDGDTIKSELDNGVNSTMANDGIDRDSDHDNGIIVHEYGHGISNRLTGGPLNSGCLGNSEQMGEGWSDWYALVLTAVESDTGPMARGIGNYANFDPVDGLGIRTHPYSTDFGVNDLTYADIAFQSIPHGVGEVWAAATWDMYWNLVDEYGFGDLWTEPNSGNAIALQLVNDGLKMQPCSPHFVDGRDAILEADMVNNGGANECLIWEAFAKRGLGVSADAGSSFSVTDGTEAFDLPPQCDGAVGLDVSLSGSCPGVMTVDITGVTPGATVAIGISPNMGNVSLPNGPCAGTQIDLGGPITTRRELVADGNGTVSFDAEPGAGACGQFLQAVDFSTCEVSDVVTVP